MGGWELCGLCEAELISIDIKFYWGFQDPKGQLCKLLPCAMKSFMFKESSTWCSTTLGKHVFCWIWDSNTNNFQKIYVFVFISMLALLQKNNVQAAGRWLWFWLCPGCTEEVKLFGSDVNGQKQTCGKWKSWSRKGKRKNQVWDECVWCFLRVVLGSPALHHWGTIKQTCTTQAKYASVTTTGEGGGFSRMAGKCWMEISNHRIICSYKTRT